jgi:predicted RNase H-like HicB family nuclease
MIEKIPRPKNYDWDGYTINLYLDEQEDWLAYLVEMPNVSAFGNTPEEALDELYEAWEAIKDCYLEDGETIPVAPKRQKLIPN